MSADGSQPRASFESDSLELDDLFDSPDDLSEAQPADVGPSLQSVARPHPTLRRESVSSASLGFDDLDDFCAPAALKATERQIGLLRRCIKYYSADGDGPFEDHKVDAYFHELVGIPKVRGVDADHLRLKQFLSETSKYETRHEEVRAKTRKMVRKVQTVMKMAHLQDGNADQLRNEDPESKLAVKDKRRNSKVRRNSVVARGQKPKESPKEKEKSSEAKKKKP
eukprot:s1026_g10.t1